MSEVLNRLEGRTPRLAALLARARARIRANWFAVGAAFGVLLALSVILIIDSGVAGGWWNEPPPFSRPGSDPSFALWVWHNSGFLLERALVLLLSGLIGGLAGLACGRRSRAWVPAGVAEALDRLWGREYEFTSAVVAMSEKEVTPAAAALGIRVEQQLRATLPRSLRGLGLGIPGRRVLRALGAVLVLLVGSSLTSHWLSTHSPSRDTYGPEAVSGASPLDSTFLALQGLADRLEEEAARSSTGHPLETEPPAVEEAVSEAAEGQGAGPARADDRGQGGGQGLGGKTKESPGRGYEEALLEAATSLRQAADLVLAGGQTALPYARDLVLRAFNQLLQERVNLGSSAAGVDALLQEMSSAAHPLLAANRMAGSLSGLTQAQGLGQRGTSGQGQGTDQGLGSRVAPLEPGVGSAQQAARTTQSIAASQGEPMTGAMAGAMTGPTTGQSTRLSTRQSTRQLTRSMYGSVAEPAAGSPEAAGAAAVAEPGQTEDWTGEWLLGVPGGSSDSSPGDSTGDPEAAGGQASGVAAGTGRGSGDSAQRLTDPRTLALPSMTPQLLPGDIGQGPIWVTESGRLPQGVTVDEYGLTSQAAAADTGIDRESVPLAYRDWIRRYFGGL